MYEFCTTIDKRLHHLTIYAHILQHIRKGDVIISEESEKWYSRLVVISIVVPIDSGFSVYIAASRKEGETYHGYRKRFNDSNIDN